MKIIQAQNHKLTILNAKEFPVGSFFSIPGKEYLYQVIKWEDLTTGAHSLYVLVYASGDQNPVRIALNDNIQVHRAYIKTIYFSLEAE